MKSLATHHPSKNSIVCRQNRLQCSVLTLCSDTKPLRWERDEFRTNKAKKTKEKCSNAKSNAREIQKRRPEEEKESAQKGGRERNWLDEAKKPIEKQTKVFDVVAQ